MFADERSTTLYVVWLPVLYVLSSLIILGLYLGLPLDLLRAFEHQWLTAVGRLSYSIYLVHVVCISLAARVAGWFAFGPTLNLTLTFTVALGLTALSSALLHRFVERPALRMKQRFAAT
jgi:peptidoglycan/LPS O-acetylase OafA/YrhL